jgi:hypothetical protein
LPGGEALPESVLISSQKPPPPPLHSHPTVVVDPLIDPLIDLVDLALDLPCLVDPDLVDPFLGRVIIGPDPYHSHQLVLLLVLVRMVLVLVLVRMVLVLLDPGDLDLHLLVEGLRHLLIDLDLNLDLPPLAHPPHTPLTSLTRRQV